jgi:hypothetical protein
MVFPAYGVVFSKGINGFFDLDPHTRRHDGDRTALWLFLIAIISTCTMGIQNYVFANAAATLSAKIQSLSFRAILRQDSKFLASMHNCSVLFYHRMWHNSWLDFYLEGRSHCIWYMRATFDFGRLYLINLV